MADSSRISTDKAFETGSKMPSAPTLILCVSLVTGVALFTASVFLATPDRPNPDREVSLSALSVAQ